MQDTNNYLNTLMQQSEGRTPKEIAIAIKQLRQMMFVQVEDKEQHLTSVIFFSAYKYMLETNSSSKDCLIYAANLHMKEVEKILSEKSRPSGRMSRKVVKNYDDHPIQKDMIKRKKFNRQALSNSNNLWQLLNTLSSFRQSYQELLDLEKMIKELQDDMSTTKTELSLAKADINRLNELLGLGEMTDREKVRHLKESGATQQQASEIVGKSIATIKRWWNK